jgi:hypothetical protein
LKTAEQSVRRQIIPVKRLELLDELYRVRGEEKKFLEGILGMGLQPIYHTQPDEVHLDKNATVLISRMNLPAADEIFNKQNQTNGWGSLEHKQDSATNKSHFRKQNEHNAPIQPQFQFAENSTGQESMIHCFSAFAPSSVPFDTKRSATEAKCQPLQHFPSPRG